MNQEQILQQMMFGQIFYLAVHFNIAHLPVVASTSYLTSLACSLDEIY